MEIRKLTSNQSLALLLITIGVIFRLLPHEPNLAPIGALALFCGAILGFRSAMCIPVSMMIISDMIIGFYPGMMFTWAAFMLVALYGTLFKNASLLKRMSLGSVGGASIFFIVSNFGVWIVGGMYSLTFAGLAQCYYMALPFFRATLVGDLAFGAVLFGSYAVALYISANRERIANSLYLHSR